MKSNRRTDPQSADAVHVALSVMIPRIMFVVRTAANEEFKRELGLNELELRMISEIGQRGGLTLTNLVGLIGQDKAQVSRTLKRLTQSDLVRRASLRAPFELSPAGLALFDDLATRAVVGNRLLLMGFSQVERAEFTAAVDKLTAAAARLLAEERQTSPEIDPRHFDELSNQNRAEIQPNEPAGSSRYTAAKIAALSEAIIPKLVTLVSLLQRGSLLSLKRLTGLSNFDSLVLACVWEYAPIPFSQLVKMTNRRKSQVERSIRHLLSLEYISRTKNSGSKEWIFEGNRNGSAVYMKLSKETNRRESVLLEAFDADEEIRLKSYIYRISSNATAIARQ